MTSNVIVPVSSPVSSHELANFLSADGVGAGFVRHQDIWCNNDEFLDMVWALIRAPRKDGSLMKLLYIRHTVIETELVVQRCDKQWGAQAQCGVFPGDDVRVGAMTFSQARRLFAEGEALCENMVILVDGSYQDTTDTEIAMGLMNQSINPASCVKILGLYNREWDDQAAEKAVPLFSPLFGEVGVQKLSVSFTRTDTMATDPRPTLVDQRGLVDAMVKCVNQGKHIAFFLPYNIFVECLGQIRESPEREKAIRLRKVSLTGETSMSAQFDQGADIGQIFQNDSLLVEHYLNGAVMVCSVLVAIDPDAGFTTIPFKRVGLVVFSHLTGQGQKILFNDAAGVVVFSRNTELVSHLQMRSQSHTCRGISARRVWLYKGRLGRDSLAVDYSKEFVFELIRNWPGKPMADVPLNMDRRDVKHLKRTMRHLAVAGLIEPYQNGFMLTKTKGAEMARTLPIAAKYGLSFELASLVASCRHGTAHPKSKRLLIRLAVIGARLEDFLAGLLGPDLLSRTWMEEARQQMAGPARDRMATGRLWFALGIWERMRQDTDNFSDLPKKDPTLEEDEYFSLIQGIGRFHYKKAVEIWVHVLELEDRVGLPLLGSSNPRWEEPLTSEELHDVQIQLLLAFISNLAVWELGTGKISLVSSGYALNLAPSSLLVHEHIAKLDKRPEKCYLILPDRVEAVGANGDQLLAGSALCMGTDLLKVVRMILGESVVDWLKWP